MGELATHLIPTEFLAEYGGRVVAGGHVQCAAESDLSKLNQGLRADGGWFNDQQLFFAEGTPTFDDVPDYFYLDAEDPQPRPVRYFHLNPTDVGVCAASLEDFVQAIWRIKSDWDHQYFPHTTADGLQVLIRRAFANVVQPESGRISDSYGPEAESTVDFFRGRTWQRLDGDELAGCEGMSFLSPEAWHYFLPAFLLATVKKSDSDLAVNTMIHLQGFRAKEADPALADYHAQRWNKLSDDQVAVLRELFDWMNAVGS